MVAARINAGWISAQKFAHEIGVQPHTYRTYERGESFPKPLILLRICRTLGITPNDLLTDN